MKTIQRYLKMMLVLVAMLMGIQAMAQDVKEAYAVLNHDNNSLVFYCDSEREVHTEGKYNSFDLNEDANMPAWSDFYIATIEFDKSFEEARPTTTYHWINSTVSNIIGLEYLNTSEVTNMGEMFRDCILLESIDLSHFNTSKVTNMYAMFYGCICLTELDVSKFDTSQVTEMTEMFTKCYLLKELDVSNFKTGNVLYMQEMFSYCTNLKRLDLRNFDTGKVLTMPFMFEGCTGLESIDMSKFNTSSLVNMNGMFHGCESLTSLDLSSFDTQEVSNMDHLFFNCNSLATIYVGDKWSTSNVDERYSYFLFNGCEKLVGGAGTKYSDTTYDHLLYARIDGGPSSETPGYLTYKEPSGISTGMALQDISDRSQATSDGWYTLDGRKISGKPNKQGMYINNGKKITLNP